MRETCDLEVAIVDDDAAVLDSLRFVLEVVGFKVATFPSAAAFLVEVPHRARCLILDQHMPGMTGLELLAKLRADGVQVSVLLITAAPSDDIRRRASQLGVERVLAKPLAEDDLVNFVLAFG